MGWLSTEQPSEQPGLSCFLRDGDAVFHTYSTYARGTEQVGGAYNFLDMTALGRQEDLGGTQGPLGNNARRSAQLLELKAGSDQGLWDGGVVRYLLMMCDDESVEMARTRSRGCAK